MAEGWARYLHPDTIEAFSAGTMPDEVNPLAIQVMGEVGVDLANHRSKHLKEYLDQSFDYVVTLSGDAHENCPVFPQGGHMVHVGFPDPAQATGSHEDVLAEFRRVRDMIRAFVEGLPATLQI
jgi:arsenate reductase